MRRRIEEYQRRLGEAFRSSYRTENKKKKEAARVIVKSASLGINSTTGDLELCVTGALEWCQGVLFPYEEEMVSTDVFLQQKESCDTDNKEKVLHQLQERKGAAYSFFASKTFFQKEDAPNTRQQNHQAFLIK